ncbi:hypothetical protein MYP_2058 [Sporocytophaga myxococcoides]|uniref:Transglutaminase-like domain-containing protein n=1 Tax=Sporocytophaga myxococcoides TaxID=153721 RepID=A0A098LD47_9BACT|nr:transglutaminase domain-containing protein [Sporocytophaga myxococcoides]GAL84830.1 hypothetical protein MYP_2058 [Sporocytophaga myxococcoides]
MYTGRNAYLLVEKKLFFFLWLFPSALFGQQLNELVSLYQHKFKESEAVIINSESEYEFDLVENKVTIKEDKSQKLLSLRYNTFINEVEFYDSNSDIEEFSCESSLNQKSVNSDRVCGNYTNSEYFFDDNKFCSHKLKLQEAGEIWKTHLSKVYNDSKYLTSVYFHDRYPIINKRIILKIPLDIEVDIREFNFEKFVVKKYVTPEGRFRIVEYSISNLSAMENVRLGRSIQFIYPHLLILVKSYQSEGEKVNILSSLNDLYGWYRSLTRQLSVQPEVFAPLVNSILKGKMTDDERIGTIFYWVQDNIRYIAFENGLAGFKPDEAHSVFQKKYGDCKGMANLTKEMLRYAGYDARLSWIGTKRIKYDYSIPSLAVDNHMICTVLLDGKKYFLDATEKYLPLGIVADRIQGRQILIEDGENYILEKIPEGSKENEMELRQVRLSMESGMLVGSYKYILQGEKKRNFLFGYHFSSGSTKDKLVKNCLIDENKNMRVNNIQLSDLNQRVGVFEINTELECMAAISSFNNELYIDIDISKDFKNWIVDENRESDIDFGEMIYKVLEVELELKDGDSVLFLPEQLKIEHEEFSVHAFYVKEPNRILYKKRIVIENGVISKDSFIQWNEAIRKLTQHYGSQIILKR